MSLSSGVGVSAFKRLKIMFGKKVTLQRMTQTFDDDTGDEIDTISSSSTIIAIFDMDNDTSLDRGDGRHTLGINLVYVDGDVTLSKFDRLIDGSSTYQIENIKKGVGSATTVYQALVVKEII